jgi:hypothetical protein
MLLADADADAAHRPSAAHGSPAERGSKGRHAHVAHCPPLRRDRTAADAARGDETGESCSAPAELEPCVERHPSERAVGCMRGEAGHRTRRRT